MGPVYLFENNLRRVKPYLFEYKTPFKQRWHQRSVKDILTTELGQAPEVVDHGIDLGFIYVTSGNGRAGEPGILRFSDAHQRLLQPHDIIYNLQHMHEPPVWQDTAVEAPRVTSEYEGVTRNAYTREKWVVLFENDDLMVLDKPAGVPTHPSGIHRFNSVTEIVHHDFGFPVYPCHRLDKGTLGVLVLAKNKPACKKFQTLIQANKDAIEKWYVARVQGKFTHPHCTYTSPVFSINTAGLGYLNTNAEAVPARVTTHFELVSYSESLNESIVLCRPISGKTHQIRIHLRNMGFPIQNDPLYNLALEPNREKGLVETALYDAVLAKWPCFGINKTGHVPQTVNIAPLVANLRSRIVRLSEARRKNDSAKISSTCRDCLRPLHQENPDQGIYLHALKMSHGKDPSFSFQASSPQWMFTE